MDKLSTSEITINRFRRDACIFSINGAIEILNRKIKILKIHRELSDQIENSDEYIAHDLEVINNMIKSINSGITLLNKKENN